MPRTIRQSLRKEVFVVDEGIRMGRPQDMLIDPEHHRVALLIMANRSIPHVATVIGGELVQSYAEDTLPIASLSSVRLGYQLEGAVDLIARSLHFRGRDVMTSAGHNVGRIVDVLLADDGTVIEYRVAKGLLRRLLRMTKPVTPAQLRTAGEQVAVEEVAESPMDKKPED